MGDASIVEGTSGSRVAARSRSRCRPARRGHTVTVYWSTAPGHGHRDRRDRLHHHEGEADLHRESGDEERQRAVKPDTTDEPNEQMALVLAGVDGGREHPGAGDRHHRRRRSGLRRARGVGRHRGGGRLGRPLAGRADRGELAAGDRRAVHWSTVADTAAAGSRLRRAFGHRQDRARPRAWSTVSIPLVARRAWPSRPRRSGSSSTPRRG